MEYLFWKSNRKFVKSEYWSNIRKREQNKIEVEREAVLESIYSKFTEVKIRIFETSTHEKNKRLSRAVNRGEKVRGKSREEKLI